MDLISIIIIVVIIKKVIEKVQGETKENNRSAQGRRYASTPNRSYSSSQNDQWKQTARNEIEKVRKKAVKALKEVENVIEIEDKPAGTYEMPKRNVRTTPVYEQVTLQSYKEEQEVREKIARTKQRILESRGQQENRSAMQQVHMGRMEAKNTSILERAIKNADEDKVDVTLTTMEAEHNHSERVAPATHHHPEDVIPENMLGTIEDLMIKGYDGSLCFERDFVGEAMDMINRFTVPTDIPDFSKSDIA